MTLRMKIMLAAVAALVVINLWRWWPQAEEETSTAGRTQEASTSMLELRLAGYDPRSADGEVNIRRDLFFPVSETEPATAEEQKTASEQQEQRRVSSRREQILADMKQYKLVGVLSRNGVRQGFLVRDEENFSVRRGDRLENRYSVDEISLTSVTLSDPASRVSRKIELE